MVSRLIDWYGFKIYADNIPRAKPGVYSLTNLLDGSRYIGASKDIANRIHYHLTKARRGDRDLKITRALADVGAENFLAEPLLYVPDGNQKALDAAEKHFITVQGHAAGDYNVVGGPLLGSKWTDEQRANRATAFAKLEVQQRRRGAMKVAWTRAETRQRYQEGLTRTQDERTVAITEAWSDPALRAAQSSRLSKYLATHSEERERRVKQLSAYAPPTHKGTRWITNGMQIRRIAADAPLPSGWRYGRLG